MKKIAMIAAMVALTCADGHAQGLLNRLGRVLAKPGTVGAYAVVKVVDEECGEEYTYVKDAAGEIAIFYYPDYMMEIFSPDFRLENGIRAGMTIGEDVSHIFANVFEIELF